MALNFCKILSGAILPSLLTLSSELASAQDAYLRLENGRVWVSDLDPEVLYTFTRYFNSQSDWECIFPVQVRSGVDHIVINGTYKVFENSVVFTPRFPFANHVDYLALFHLEELYKNANEIYLPKISRKDLRLMFRISPVEAVPAEVVTIYPTSGLLPENLLKFHITFSKPMTSGEIYNKLKLLDANGQEVEKAFLILDQELWDSEMKTVTVLFDPGRIKRGLRPNLEMKPALQVDETYTLRIEGGWKDIDGLMTTKTVTKEFKCIAADRTSPSIASYKVYAPKHSAGPLAIDLQEPHDFILLSRYIIVRDPEGEIVPGSLTIGANETQIEFVPKYPWLEAKYTIDINPLLEDLAGNNLNRLFDEDVTLSSAKPNAGDRLSFTFSQKAH